MPKMVAFALMLLIGTASALADEASPGEAELKKCQICHALNQAGGNRVGPNLFGVFGRKAGTVAGFAYSVAMKNSGIVWDDETLAKFLRDPKDFLPGNRMSFPGVKDPAALQDLLARLKQATH